MFVTYILQAAGYWCHRTWTPLFRTMEVAPYLRSVSGFVDLLLTVEGIIAS